MSEQLTNFLNSDDAIFHYTKKENAMERILNEKQLKFGLYREIMPLRMNLYFFHESCIYLQ